MVEPRLEESSRKEPVTRGVLVILATGVLLGAGYNLLARQSAPSRGLPWIAEKVELADLDGAAKASVEGAGAGFPADLSGSTTYAGENNDPMALVGPAEAGGDLPQIPDIGRPIQMQLLRVKQFFDKKAAMIIDARDLDEYAAGHIAGAVNLPYDQAITDPERLTNLDSGGKAIIIYCGGGTCEVSINLGYALMQAGQKKVLVYAGGYPEWEAAGFPIEKGSPGPAETR